MLAKLFSRLDNHKTLKKLTSVEVFSTFQKPWCTMVTSHWNCHTLKYSPYPSNEFLLVQLYWLLESFSSRIAQNTVNWDQSKIYLANTVSYQILIKTRQGRVYHGQIFLDLLFLKTCKICNRHTVIQRSKFFYQSIIIVVCCCFYCC